MNAFGTHVERMPNAQIPKAAISARVGLDLLETHSWLAAIQTSVQPRPTLAEVRLSV